MFTNPFSFEGRIRRTEYGISVIIYAIIGAILNVAIVSGGGLSILAIGYIPALWFLWAQGAKRCHDLGNNGWWQLIPLYGLWMLFQDGQGGQNEYGENPKGISAMGNSTILDDSFTTSTGDSYSFKDRQGSSGTNNPSS